MAKMKDCVEMDSPQKGDVVIKKNVRRKLVFEKKKEKLIHRGCVIFEPRPGNTGIDKPKGIMDVE